MMRMPKRVVNTFRRVGVHYLLFIAAGSTALVYPPASVEESSVLSVSVYFWCGCLIIGGALCAYGRWRRTFTPKTIGLRLLMVALATYVVGLSTSWPERVASMCFLLAFMSMLSERLIHVRACRDARLAIGSSRNGQSPGPDLVAYARDSLARRGIDYRSDTWRTQTDRNEGPEAS